MEEEMIKVTLKKGEEKRIQMGHPWIFDNEVKSIEGFYDPGDIVDVHDFKGGFLGRGYINNKSKIIIPAFSVGKTQEIVYALHKIFENGKAGRIPVYVDSPLAVNATSVFRLHPECFDSETAE